MDIDMKVVSIFLKLFLAFVLCLTVTIGNKREFGRWTGLPWLKTSAEPPGYSLTNSVFLQPKSDVIYFLLLMSDEDADIKNVPIVPKRSNLSQIL